MKNKLIIGIVFFIMSIIIVSAWTPPSDGNLYNTYGLYNVTNISAMNITASGSFIGNLIGGITINENIDFRGFSLINATEVNSTLFYQNGNLVLDNTSNIPGSKIDNMDLTCGSDTFQTAMNFTDESITCTAIADIYLKNDGDTATGDYTFDTTTLKVDSGNNRVGIGTITPTLGTLEVVPSAAGTAIASTGAFSNIKFDIRPTGADSEAMIRFRNDADYWSIGIDGDDSDKFKITDTFADTFSGSRFVLQQDGRLGLGTTTPQSKLDVNGEIRSTSLNTSGIIDSGAHYLNGILYFGTRGVTPRIQISGNALYFTNVASNQMIFDTGGALSGVGTLDTGQGANELYDMDQNVLTTSDVEFNRLDITQSSNNIGLNIENAGTSGAFNIHTSTSTTRASIAAVKIFDQQDNTGESEWEATFHIQGKNGAGQIAPLFATYSYAANNQKSIYVNHNGNGTGVEVINSGTGNGIYIDQNGATGEGIEIDSESASHALLVNSASTGDFAVSIEATKFGLEIKNTDTNDASISIQQAGNTCNIIVDADGTCDAGTALGVDNSIALCMVCT